MKDEQEGKLTKEVVFGLAMPAIIVGVLLFLLLKNANIKHN